MPFLTANDTFGLGRRCQSSPQRCYLHCLRTAIYMAAKPASMLAEPGLADFWFSLFTCTGTKPLKITGASFLWAWYPSCHPTNSVRAPKATQSTDPNWWPGLILSSYTNGLHYRTSEGSSAGPCKPIFQRQYPHQYSTQPCNDNLFSHEWTNKK